MAYSDAISEGKRNLKLARWTMICDGHMEMGIGKRLPFPIRHRMNSDAVDRRPSIKWMTRCSAYPQRGTQHLQNGSDCHPEIAQPLSGAPYWDNPGKSWAPMQ